MKWLKHFLNLSSDGSLWILTPSAENEVGCIHTSQGLEVDYIGVIIGSDMVYRNDRIITNPAMRAGRAKIDRIIKNTYKTLMTRGMKGCYVFCTDKETEDYFRLKVNQ